VLAATVRLTLKLLQIMRALLVLRSNTSWTQSPKAVKLADQQNVSGATVGGSNQASA
jgi:hypothetical protein